jgi:diaminopimelate epimerase
MSSAIQFRKMNGLGNDFVVLDARARPLALEAAQIAAIADRSRGIGCDQVIALEPSDFADVFMRIWNADGGEVGACGNAARCVAALLVAERGSPHVSIETESGMLAATVAKDGSVTIDMGTPRFEWNEIPLSRPFDDTRAVELPEVGDLGLGAASMVNVGNPHCIFFVENIEAHDLASFGPVLEHDPLFPERANISLAQVTGPSSLRLRTWERGAGLTRACGTAACAAAVAAARLGLTGRKVTVTLPGGDLVIDWQDGDDHILMTGPFALDYQGTIPPELLEGEMSRRPA